MWDKTQPKVLVCFQMLKMSTGHMEGDLQPLYLLLTDCYIYLLRKGNCSCSLQSITFFLQFS